MRTIRKLDNGLTFYMDTLLPEICTDTMLEFYQILQANRWQFIGTQQTRGWCAYVSKVITLPRWVFKDRPVDYQRWYLSHEMAHAFAGYKAHHGRVFMAELKRICPTECQQYEFSYKPKNALSAGLQVNID